MFARLRQLFEPKPKPNDASARLWMEANAAYERARILARQKGHEQAAVEEYDRALKGGIAGALIYGDRGMCLHVLGFEFDAIEDLDKAIALEPHDSNLFFLRSLAHRNTGEFKKAVEDGTEAVRVAAIDNASQRAYDSAARDSGHGDAARLYWTQLQFRESEYQSHRSDERVRKDHPDLPGYPDRAAELRARVRRRKLPD